MGAARSKVGDDAVGNPVEGQRLQPHRAVAPITSRLPPGLHVFFSPLAHGRTEPCRAMKVLFGAVDCVSLEVGLGGSIFPQICVRACVSPASSRKGTGILCQFASWPFLVWSLVPIPFESRQPFPLNRHHNQELLPRTGGSLPVSHITLEGCSLSRPLVRS